MFICPSPNLKPRDTNLIILEKSYPLFCPSSGLLNPQPTRANLQDYSPSTPLPSKCYDKWKKDKPADVAVLKHKKIQQDKHRKPNTTNTLCHATIKRQNISDSEPPHAPHSLFRGGSAGLPVRRFLYRRVNPTSQPCNAVKKSPLLRTVI